MAFNFIVILNLFLSVSFLAAPRLRRCARAFSGSASGSCSPVAVRGLLVARAPRCAASLEACGLTGCGCGSLALGPVGFGSCSTAAR